MVAGLLTEGLRAYNVRLRLWEESPGNFRRSYVMNASPNVMGRYTHVIPPNILRNTHVKYPGKYTHEYHREIGRYTHVIYLDNMAYIIPRIWYVIPTLFPRISTV